MQNQKMIVNLASYFQRDMRIGNTLYRGHYNNENIPKRVSGPTSKVTIKFKQVHYFFIYDLGYVLDLSPTRVVAVLLELAMRDMATVNRYVKRYLEDELSANQMQQLKELLRYINRHSVEKHYSWSALLSAIADNTQGSVMEVKEMIAEFLRSDMYK